MQGIPTIKPISKAILVICEARSRLQKAKDLAIDAELIRCTTRRLNGVDGVERLIRGIDMQEVAVQEVDQMGQLRLFRQLPSAFKLMRIVVHTDDLGAGKAGDLQQRPTNAASEIRDYHAGLEPEQVRQSALVAYLRRPEALDALKLSPVTRGAK